MLCWCQGKQREILNRRHILSEHDMKAFPYRLSAVKWNSRIKLPFLVSAKLRIAEIADSPSVHLARGFPCGDWEALCDYRPQVVVGTQSELQLLVEEMGRGGWSLSSVDCAVVVLTYSYTALLDDVFRVTLWQMFGVPVYEMLVGPNNSLIAAECEAHEGWHVQPEADVWAAGHEIVCRVPSRSAVPTGWTGRIESERCACGRASQRLMDLARPTRAFRHELAAIA